MTPNLQFVSQGSLGVPAHEVCHSEKLDGSRGYENLGNHSIGPVFFCRFDLLNKFLDKKRSSGEKQNICIRKANMI